MKVVDALAVQVIETLHTAKATKAEHKKAS
jgi:hypothetical protein